MKDIVLALIAPVASIIVCVITVKSTLQKQNAEQIKRETEREVRTDMRLDSIEKKLDIHNGYAEKFGQIATDIAVLKQRIEDRLNNKSN